MGPQDIDPLLQEKYRTMSQMGAVRPGGVGVGLGALAIEQARKDRVAVDPFAGMKAGENRTFQSFNANQVGDPTNGGLTVISGSPSSLGMLEALRTQGYTVDEAAKLVGVGAEADLSKTKNRLLPAEAAAQNALTAAQTGQTGALTEKTRTETSLMPAEYSSIQALRRAQSGLYGGQEAAARAEALNTGTQELYRNFLEQESPQPKKLFSPWKFGRGLK